MGDFTPTSLNDHERRQLDAIETMLRTDPRLVAAMDPRGAGSAIGPLAWRPTQLGTRSRLALGSALVLVGAAAAPLTVARSVLVSFAASLLVAGGTALVVRADPGVARSVRRRLGAGRPRRQEADLDLRHQG